MRKVLLVFALSLLCILPEVKAQLQAHAGNDTTWCSFGTSASPVLGGNPTATGGTAPYSYQWAPLTGATSYLDNVSLANPAVVVRPASQSVIFVDYQLTVTDNASNVARDTVRVYFSMFVCTTGECIKTKGTADTVQLGLTCSGNQQPMTYSWSPASTLINPASAYARSFSPVDQGYTCIITDSRGCQAISTCGVKINNVGVGNTPKFIPAITIAPNPAGYDSRITISEAYLNSALSFYGVDGKLVATTTLSGLSTSLKSLLPGISNGIYFYRLSKAGLQTATGKLVIE